MAVFLELTGKGKIDKYKDDEKAVYAYQATDGGVLRILTSDPAGGSWTVVTEYSPAAWSEVSGKRFIAKVDELGGFLGGTAKPEAGKMHSFR